MFTGIVEERGTVREIVGSRLVVEAERVLSDSQVDSSIAVNGVCLTVVELGEGTLSFDVTPETFSRSSLRRLVSGDPVNLERPLTLTTRLGGHLVQGHVDGVGEVVSIEENETGATMTLSAPEQIMRYVVEKGSITVDGISLTIAELQGDSFAIALIPHTLAVTTLGRAEPGDPVNLEVDVIAKYVEGFMKKNGENDE
jgi:riboflavin synthase